MIDPHHYGSSKGAMLLADLLKDDPRTRSKIDRLMQVANERFHDITFSDMPGSTKVWCLTQAMHHTFIEFEKFVAPISTVAQNVMRAAYKESLRSLGARGEVDGNGRKFGFLKNMPAYDQRGKNQAS